DRVKRFSHELTRIKNYSRGNLCLTMVKINQYTKGVEFFWQSYIEEQNRLVRCQGLEVTKEFELMKASLACVLAVIVCTCVVPAWTQQHVHEQWIEIKSPHFRVLTDAREKQGRDLALQFEQMRAVFSQLL